MRIVDSHCHVSEGWYEPVESLLFQMDRCGVEQAVLIQLAGQTDNRYQQACLHRYSGRFASVVVVDPARPDAIASLEALVEQGASGIRLRPSSRSAGEDPLAIWRAAEHLGVAVSCSGTLPEFASPGFAELIQAVPGLPVVIEHLGSVNHPDPPSATVESRQAVFDLARFPNVAMKVHGLGEFARRARPVSEPFPFEQPLSPLLRAAYDAFGAQRLMWGSDYPPVSGREGYANALRRTLQELAWLAEPEREAIFGGTARQVFGVFG